MKRVFLGSIIAVTCFLSAVCADEAKVAFIEQFINDVDRGSGYVNEHYQIMQNEAKDWCKNHYVPVKKISEIILSSLLNSKIFYEYQERLIDKSIELRTNDIFEAYAADEEYLDYLSEHLNAEMHMIDCEMSRCLVQLKEDIDARKDIDVSASFVDLPFLFDQVIPFVAAVRIQKIILLQRLEEAKREGVIS